MNISSLEKLTNADGIVSCETEVREVLKKTLSPYVDETSFDGLGSMICLKKGTGKGPKVMILGHMDEVGYMVRSVTEGGLLMLMVVGGIKTSEIYYQKLRVTTQEGKKIEGIVAGEYDRTATSKMYMDVGASSKEEVQSLGIRVGDMVTFATEFTQLDLPNIYAGKAMDDRLACFVLGEVASALNETTLNCDVYYTGTVGEEVGLRGAKTATELVNPDLCFVIDVATYPNQFVRDNTNNRQIGKGPMLTHFDKTLAPNRELIRFVRETAENSEIPLQFDMFNNGGTDGGEAHKVNGGKPTVVTCLPCRYGHCAWSIIDMTDVQHIINLYVELLKKIDGDFVKKLTDF